jgi:undecaprenyl-diphosphatase
MIEQINITLFHLINQYAGLNPSIDTIIVLMAQYMPVVIILVLAYLWIHNGNKYRNIVLYGIYASIIGLLMNFVIGLIYFHPRPFMIQTGTQLFQYPAETSFPSDHTTFMISIALTLIYFKETRMVGIGLFILGLIGGFARVFSGVHFPFDIFGAIIVSIFASILIYLFKDQLNPLNNAITRIYIKLLIIKKNILIFYKNNIILSKIFLENKIK